MKISKHILVSFNHGVAIMLNGRAIIVGCAVCEELFQAETQIVPKKQKSTQKQVLDDAQKLTLDFPMFLRVISLADGQPLDQPVEILVKWNNISAICNL
jgi:hypothetical protein